MAATAATCVQSAQIIPQLVAIKQENGVYIHVPIAIETQEAIPQKISEDIPKKKRGRPRKEKPIPETTCTCGFVPIPKEKPEPIPKKKPEPIQKKKPELKHSSTQCYILFPPTTNDNERPKITKEKSTQCSLQYNTTQLNLAPETESGAQELVEVHQIFRTNKFLVDVIATVAKYATLEYTVSESRLEIIRRGWVVPECVNEPPVKLRILNSGEAYLLILFQAPQQYMLKTDGDLLNIIVLNEILRKLEPNSGFLFCLGLKDTDSLNVKSFSYPAVHHQSRKCTGLFNAMRKNDGIKRLGFGICSNCIKTQTVIRRKRKRYEELSEMEKYRELTASSRTALKWLSPENLKIRKRAIMLARKADQQRISVLEKKLKNLTEAKS